MDKKLLFLILIIISLFLVSCAREVAVEQPSDGKSTHNAEKEAKEETPEEEPMEEEKENKLSCGVNADCEQGLLCIDGDCGTIAELYNTECENKCSITSVTVLTSDDETYTLKLGQGSYSYAGALEWRLVSTPQYCPGADPLVPIKIIKKNYGKILSEQVLTLHKGETSDVINHPTVKSLEFTTTLQEVVENCS